MWNHLPFDLLAHIFSFLPPDSLARATSACKHWHTCAKTCPVSAVSLATGPHRHPPWFLAIQARDRSGSCYAYNPALDRWHVLPLDFVPDPIRPVGPIGGLLLCRPAIACSVHLIICNPFTRRYRLLPPLITARANPAIGVISFGDQHVPSFQVYVAGGMSDISCGGGASYEPTLEMYDPKSDTWLNLGAMPVEFAVRLTVWTPNESVYADGALYWMTSARAYSVMGFEVRSRTWREVKAPMADQLECAAIVRRMGRLAIFGGTCGGGACIWELGVGDEWTLIEVVPNELGRRFLGVKGSWGSTKCVGCDEAMYLYKDLGWGMLVWREVPHKARWEWFWVDGCTEVKRVGAPKVPFKGVILHPTLAPLLHAS
ncbi:protein UNUSUAL FLORAL ORGANS-like [Magnolia sinica]|uniref:protein UNUSUAL FLORAL ORGANS-like n=1 Tax=Magnolia sinica TaxID=86752 RepID=UPI00265AFA09|nr:protein UNUSUAL FLORAL ORGANS-like [Magnolia sinica]